MPFKINHNICYESIEGKSILIEVLNLQSYYLYFYNSNHLLTASFTIVTFYDLQCKDPFSIEECSLVDYERLEEILQLK